MGNQEISPAELGVVASGAGSIRSEALLAVLWTGLAGGLPLLVATAGGGLALAALTWLGATGWAFWGARNRAERRDEALRQVSRALEEMDDTPVRLSGVDQEVDTFLRRWNALARKVFTTRQAVVEWTEWSAQLPEASKSAFGEVERGGEKQEEALEEAASLVANMRQSVVVIEESTELLREASDEATSSVHEMSASIDEIAGNTSSLHDVVDASTTAVNQMGTSIRQVASGAEHVLEMAESTASAVEEMDRSVQEVSTNAVEAASATEEAHAGAELGADAVQATIDDIERISALTIEAKARLGGLVSGISRIGNVLAAINEINDETNLLSLNAAIIAAQAGEQGKAFRVVANHVKTLARRTSASTDDIETLIQDIEAESGEAVRAMEAGINAVAASVDRSRDAGNALGSIRESCRNASERVTEIARATEEQSRNSKGVAEATQQTTMEIQQISQAILEQRRASESLLSSAESALERCQLVHRSTEEQRQSSRHITAAMSEIANMIRTMGEQTRSHAVASEAVSASVICLLDEVEATGTSLRPLRDLLHTIESQALPSEILRRE
ncbi:MAG: methyl-accepting chemotaxis protein [Myxococcota bacterium]